MLGGGNGGSNDSGSGVAAVSRSKLMDFDGLRERRGIVRESQSQEGRQCIALRVPGEVESSKDNSLEGERDLIYYCHMMTLTQAIDSQT